MRTLLISLLIALCGAGPAAAQVSFAGKTINMMVPYAPGGGTDLAGRLVAEYFGKYLPGTPAVVVRNVPGADGMVGMNRFVLESKPDGLNIVTGSGTTADPLQYRKPAARFDPTRYNFVGGVGRGAFYLIVNKEAAKRLHDKSAAPVTMGTIGGVPRAAMAGTLWGVEFLGWNVRWVLGYPGTSELFLALERGEIDMTATGVLSQITRLLNTGRFEILTSYEVAGGGRPQFSNVPVFVKMMDGRLRNPTEKKAFDYYLGMLAIDKWFALPPDTPAPIAAAYRDAFARMSKDPEFLERGRKQSEEFVPMPGDDVARIVTRLGETPPDAIAFLDTMLKKQGLLSQ